MMFLAWLRSATPRACSLFFWRILWRIDKFLSARLYEASPQEQSTSWTRGALSLCRQKCFLRSVLCLGLFARGLARRGGLFE